MAFGFLKLPLFVCWHSESFWIDVEESAVCNFYAPEEVVTHAQHFPRKLSWLLRVGWLLPRLERFSKLYSVLDYARQLDTPKRQLKIRLCGEYQLRNSRTNKQQETHNKTTQPHQHKPSDVKNRIHKSRSVFSWFAVRLWNSLQEESSSFLFHSLAFFISPLHDYKILGRKKTFVSATGSKISTARAGN